MGQGLAVEESAELARGTGLQVIGSGGVARLDDVRSAYSADLAGVIIGRALYEGQIELDSALAIGSEDNAG
jgi:phosphoribosylformimino-5-aminoimidazole carboxamide ribotide isomerase